MIPLLQTSSSITTIEYHSIPSMARLIAWPSSVNIHTDYEGLCSIQAMHATKQNPLGYNSSREDEQLHQPGIIAMQHHFETTERETPKNAKKNKEGCLLKKAEMITASLGSIRLPSCRAAVSRRQLQISKEV